MCPNANKKPKRGEPPPCHLPQYRKRRRVMRIGHHVVSSGNLPQFFVIVKHKCARISRLAFAAALLGHMSRGVAAISSAIITPDTKGTAMGKCACQRYAKPGLPPKTLAIGEDAPFSLRLPASRRQRCDRRAARLREPRDSNGQSSHDTHPGCRPQRPGTPASTR